MTTTITLWSAIAIQVVFAGVSLETRSWITLLGQFASLTLLGYVAWKVRCRRRVGRKRQDD